MNDSMAGPPLEFRRVGEEQVAAWRSAGRLIGFRGDGMFARVNTHLNSLRLGRRLHLPVTTLWPTGDLGSNAHHGYERSITSIIADDAIVDVTAEDLNDRMPTVNQRVNRPVVLPGERVEDVLDELSTIARALPLHDGRQVSDLIPEVGYDAGLHMRLGDAAQSRWLLTKFLPPSVWMRVVSALLARDASIETLYIATDDPVALSEIREAHPGLVVCIDDTMTESDKLTRDFMDSVHLAGCRTMVIPSYSNLSVFSRYLGTGHVEYAASASGLEDVLAEMTSLIQKRHRAELAAVIRHLTPDQRKRAPVPFLVHKYALGPLVDPER